MIHKLRHWLGIEGVKVSIELDARADLKSAKTISGVLLLSSKRPENVDRIVLALKERYVRGRWKEKKVSDFTLGELVLKGPFAVNSETPTQIPFKLSFTLIKSDFDLLEEKNLVYKGVAQTAKWVQGVKSEYWLEAEAFVKGRIISAFTKKFLK